MIIASRNKQIWRFNMKNIILTICFLFHVQVLLSQDKIQNEDSKGFMNITDIGFLLGPGGHDPVSINVVHAYRFADYFSVGAGTGFEFYNETNAPVFGDIRFTWFQKVLSPTVFIQTGYAFPMMQPYSYWGQENEAFGGILFNTGTGVFVYINDNTHLYVGVGYRYQELHFERHISWSNETIPREEKYQRLNIRIGLMFK